MGEYRPIRVVIVDDEALMRAGIRLMIDGIEGITVVGEARDGDEALTQVEELDPDVVLMDLRMPNRNGIEATQSLVDAGHRAAVVVLTAFDTDELLLGAFRAGALSFLLKDSQPETVVSTIRDAARGEGRVSPGSLRVSWPWPRMAVRALPAGAESRRVLRA